MTMTEIELQGAALGLVIRRRGDRRYEIFDTAEQHAVEVYLPCVSTICDAWRDRQDAHDALECVLMAPCHKGA